MLLGNQEREVVVKFIVQFSLESIQGDKGKASARGRRSSPNMTVFIANPNIN
jgi:hypothetical protein